jgi:hypothetical protein
MYSSVQCTCTMYKFHGNRAVTARDRLPEWWVTRKECKKYDIDGGLNKKSQTLPFMKKVKQFRRK